MLYDPKWRQRTKADPFSLRTLVAWLETRDPRERYDYSDPNDCLLCRYFKDHGWEQPVVDPFGVSERYKEVQPYPAAFLKIAGHFDDCWTMGAALKRARHCEK
jgi:hypothetical protein